MVVKSIKTIWCWLCPSSLVDPLRHKTIWERKLQMQNLNGLQNQSDKGPCYNTVLLSKLFPTFTSFSPLLGFCTASPRLLLHSCCSKESYSNLLRLGPHSLVIWGNSYQQLLTSVLCDVSFCLVFKKQCIIHAFAKFLWLLCALPPPTSLWIYNCKIMQTTCHQWCWSVGGMPA